MTTNNGKSSVDSSTDKLPTDKLKNSAQHLASAVGERALSSVSKRLTNITGRLDDYAQGNGDGGLVSALTGGSGDGTGLTGKLAGATDKVKGNLGKVMIKQAGKQVKNKVKDAAEGVGNAIGLGSGKNGNDKEFKSTNIVEQIDVGVPVDVAYDQWTRFTDFPNFMKKVENVEQVADEKLKWTAKILWSHRTWESTIIEQIPDERIVWRSEADKGYVDGAVTFHELTPDLTRILLVLEYHARGFFEKTGDLWRAQGRRVRLELKHFRRYVMTNTILNPDELEGWRGEIHDEQVVESTSDDENAAEDDDDGAVSDSDEQTGANEEPSDETGSKEEAPKDQESTTKERQKT